MAEFNLMPFSSREITQNVEKYGVDKSSMPFARSFVLAIMAGLYIGLGCMFYFIVMSDWHGAFGPGVIMGGFAFLLGLTAVVIAGAELFTGNTMLTISWRQGKVTTAGVLRNWAIVIAGNLVGSVLLAVLARWSGHYQLNGGLVGVKVLSVGYSKSTLSYEMAFARGILCNIYVCLAVWMAYAGRSVTDKILAMLLPILAFIASGSEHIVANLFYGSYALLLKGTSVAAQMEAQKLAAITLPNFAVRQIFVLLGNIVGGGIFIAGPYWFAWLRGETPAGGTK
ncbi:MAG TPA: formate/nitrite transporter family protein [Symbiobacteriaceae bacterium]|nr:formate/nitrite transporter family protein [Symbiobacteriaceae bacterium]